MPTDNRLVTRAFATAAVTTTLIVGSLTGAATAAAHIHVDADHAVRGDDALITFQVPNESEKGSPTTQVTIALPNVTSASTDVMSGWTAKLDRDGSGAYRSVTFTATPNAGIPVAQFELFPISVQLPDTDSATFPVTQTYADGTVVHWDQPPLPNGDEPEYPAPTLSLAAGPHDADTHQAGESHPSATTAVPAAAGETRTAAPDNTARALAGGALLVGTLGVGVALARRRT
ncbi:YcnI family copper-binding membrane protein [Mycolicibacterium sp. CBM1]